MCKKERMSGSCRRGNKTRVSRATRVSQLISGMMSVMRFVLISQLLCLVLIAADRHRAADVDSAADVGGIVVLLNSAGSAGLVEGRDWPLKRRRTSLKQACGQVGSHAVQLHTVQFPAHGRLRSAPVALLPSHGTA